jgi:hypothetical protein
VHLCVSVSLWFFRRLLHHRDTEIQRCTEKAEDQIQQDTNNQLIYVGTEIDLSSLEGFDQNDVLRDGAGRVSQVFSISSAAEPE